MKHGRKQMVMKHNEVGLKNPAHIENVIEVPEQIKKDGENISKEHTLLNSLCLENVRTPSNSKRHCDIETTATTTSELCQKHDEQEKVCYESEMSKGQPASAAPTSVVCAGPDSEQTLQNTDIQGGVTDQTNENDQNQEIPVSERLQQLASTLRTDYESDLKPSHISAATSDNLGMPLVPCRSTSRMDVKASMREVSQDEKPNLAVENQADHDGVIIVDTSCTGKLSLLAYLQIYQERLSRPSVDIVTEIPNLKIRDTQSGLIR
ncbi:hypothetical protein ACFE04_003725 [Oxalis oulophora]